MRFLRRADEHEDEERAALAREFGVNRVFFGETPEWWIRLTARFVVPWPRELLSVLGLYGLGVATGILLAREVGLH